MVKDMLRENPDERPLAEQIASRVKTLKEDVKNRDVTIPCLC